MNTAVTGCLLRGRSSGGRSRAVPGEIPRKELFSTIQTRFKTPQPPGSIDGYCFTCLKKTQTNWRSRVEQPDGQETIVAIINHAQFTEFSGTVLFSNARGK